MNDDYDNNLYFVMNNNETGSGDPIVEDDSNTTFTVISGIALAFGAIAIVYFAIRSKRNQARPVVHNVSAYDMRPPIGMESTSYGSRPSIIVEAAPAHTNVVALADVPVNNPFTTRV